MLPQDMNFRSAAFNSLKTALACLALLFIFAPRAHADTLTVAGSSNSTGVSDAVNFVGQSFSNNFTVTAVGQTFNFVFGQYSLSPGILPGEAGCLDDPCLTLTGTLTNPAGSLSFDGIFANATFAGSNELSVAWVTGSGPFAFTTPEGGSGQFTIQLVDFFAVNTTASTQLYNQLARITITQFTPGSAPVPEPATLLLLGTGLLGAGVARSRKARKNQRKQLDAAKS